MIDLNRTDFVSVFSLSKNNYFVIFSAENYRLEEFFLVVYIFSAQGKRIFRDLEAI